MNKAEIEAKWLEIHNRDYSNKKARPDLTDEEFRQQHGQVWANCKSELKARQAELRAKPSLASEEKKELSEIDELYPSSRVTRNLRVEVDELKARLAMLEGTR